MGREWSLVGAFHLVVVSGLGLVASSSSAFRGGDVKSSTLTLLKIGVVILLVSWVILCAWVLASFLPSQQTRAAPGYVGGTKVRTFQLHSMHISLTQLKILYALLFSLPFVGIRMIYTVISILAPSTSLNPISGAIGLRIGLSFIPELVAILAYVYAGLTTHMLRRDMKRICQRAAPRAYENIQMERGAKINSSED